MNTSENDFLKTGLTSEQVEASRRQHGRNLLTPPKRPSIWRLYAEKYKDPIIRILLIAALFSLGIGIYENEYVETIGILVAVFLATTIGFYFEYDAQKKFDILNALGQEELVTVIRDSQAMQVPRSELVVGDVVILEQGVEIPADGLLLEAINLQVNESSLTGEPICHKTTDEAHFDREATYPSNRVLRSSMVVDGHGCMKVDAVGDETEIGHVARHATTFTDIETPLNQQLNRLSKLINKVAFTISLLVFVAGTSHGLYVYFQELMPGQPIDWAIMAATLLKWFMVTVTLIVMAVPEGLPMAVTLSLALNMRRMLRTNNLVRKLHACETMGAVTVICTDKTGTLTQNRMEVADIQSDHHFEEQLAENMAVNSTALLEEGSEGQGIGNPTECAMLNFHERSAIRAKTGKTYREERADHDTLYAFPFSSELQHMTTISRVDGKIISYVKGSPESIFAMCDIAPDKKADIEHHMRQAQEQAMRIIAFAHKELPGMQDYEDEAAHRAMESGMTFDGFIAIADPLRADVFNAVQSCRKAGIALKILTGDNIVTARAIARELGLLDTGGIAVEARDVALMSDDELQAKLPSIAVIARSTPITKMRVVNLLKAAGNVVAVTGDGINDAPSLKNADIGIAMGIAGTEVSKQASDIVLLDDSFATIVRAIEWGRNIYENFKRFITFQLTVNLASVMVVLTSVLLGLKAPFTALELLWINIIMDGPPALTLGLEPGHKVIMQRQPVRRNASIISKTMLARIILTAVYMSALFLAQYKYNILGAQPGQMGTVLFTLFVFFQLFNAFNCRELHSASILPYLFSNRPMLIATGCTFVLQIFIIEYAGSFFGTVPLELAMWFKITAAAASTLILSEIARFIWRQFDRRA